MRHNKSRRARLERGFTIAELLTVCVLFGMLLTTIALVIPAVLKAPAQMQAQVDEVDAAALALYKVQRDARQSDVNGVFDCSTSPIVVCTQQSGAVATQAIAIAGDDGSSQFVNIGGLGVDQTKWKGYVVYWLAPSITGVGLDLMRAFVPESISFSPSGLPVFDPVVAGTAVTLAIALASPTVAAPDVRQLAAGISPGNIISLQMIAGVNRGDITGITLHGDTYARN
jgi:type II secretory pathway pseudopilin PulG